MAYANLADMFYHTCKNLPDHPGMMYKDGGSFQTLTFGEIEARVNDIAGGLSALGVKKDDKVILLAENSKEWAFCDFAILANGAVSVPIYTTLLAQDVKYIINDSDARIVIVSNAAQHAKVAEVEKDLVNVKQIVAIDPAGISHDKTITLEDVSRRGRELLAKKPDLIRQSVAGVTREDLATIIYTSGTTGEPKGVMLLHGNMLSNVEASLRALPFSKNDRLLSFLPLSHVFERMVGHFTANYVGATIAYAESIEKVVDNLQEVRPTVMASVPRLFEKMYARVLSNVEAASPLRQKIFHWAVGVGKAAVQYQQNNQPLPGLLGAKYKIASKLAFTKLIDLVGGNVRFFVSGGAPLSAEIGEFFTSAGLQILEGYGLTETSPVITVNRLDKFRFGSVGIKIDNVEVKIAPDGEILTRGPHVMKGYYKKEAATREVIDDEGWFHTGDIGVIDEAGMLTITDRKKNIIVTAGGKNVAPQKMENMLITSRFVEQVLVIGDKRKFCSAIIVPTFPELEKYAADHQLEFRSYKDLCDHPQVIEMMQQEIDRVNQQCASYESIKKFILVEQPFSVESGELTPSMKIKRKIVEKNYQDEIDSLYRGEPVKV